MRFGRLSWSMLGVARAPLGYLASLVGLVSLWYGAWGPGVLIILVVIVAAIGIFAAAR